MWEGARRAVIGGVSLALAASGSLAGASVEAPAGWSSLTGYCRPANHFYDPVDVPRGGAIPTPTAGVRSRRLTVDGVSMPLLKSGPRRGREAVVFVHGNPGSSQDWLDLIPRLGRKGIRTLAFDLPGFGRAEKPRNFPYTFRGYSRFFNRALSELGVRRAHLVLHDLSGPLGIAWASSHPERLESAVLLNTGFLIGYRHHYLARIWRTPGAGEAFMAQFNREEFALGVQQGQQERPLPRSFIDRIYDDFDRPTRCGILELYRSFPPNERISRPFRRWARILRRDQPGRPALVIWGANDPYVPVKHARQQQLGFPRAQIRIFGDSGHWPFADNERRTRRNVVPFLRSQFR